MSLGAGFLAAGAGTVVASLWPVPDYATAAMMGAFHTKLRAGWSPAHALGAAQSDIAAGVIGRYGLDWRNPYFWAGFVTLGEAHAD
jgi:CHAT domain-containing protein